MSGRRATEGNGFEMIHVKHAIALAAVLAAARPALAQGDPDADAGYTLSAETAAVAAGEDDAAAKASEAGAPDKDKKKEDDGDLIGALKGKPGFGVDANLAAMWMLRDELLQPTNEFRVNQARVELSWTQWKLIKAVVGIEAKGLLMGDGDTAILRDVYVRVQPLAWLGLRVGQFKKPFGKIELTGRGKLPVIRRGAANDYACDQLLYGGRDIGAMLEGRLVKSVKLDYAIGVFNGLGPNTTEIGLDGTKDLAARLEIEPAEWLGIGADASFKFIERGDLPGFVNQDNFDAVQEDEYPLGYSATDFKNEYAWMAGTAWMVGMDVVVKPDKLRVVLEGNLGENWWFQKYPYVWSAALVASYKFRLVKGVPLWLEPAVRGEVMSFLTDGMDNWRARLWTIAPGVNLHVGKHVRLMIDGEFQFAQGTEASFDGTRRSGLWPNEYAGNWADSKKLMIQLGFNI
jgi:hypothetical protein